MRDDEDKDDDEDDDEDDNEDKDKGDDEDEEKEKDKDERCGAVGRARACDDARDIGSIAPCARHARVTHESVTRGVMWRACVRAAWRGAARSRRGLGAARSVAHACVRDDARASPELMIFVRHARVRDVTSRAG